MLEKTKILFLTNKLRIGGAELIMVNQANLINKNEFEVFLGALYPTNKEENLYGSINSDVKTLNFGFKRLFDINGLLNLYKFLKKEKIKIIFCSLFEANFSSRIAGLLARVPIIIINEQSVYWDKNYWQIIADRILSYWTDKIVTNAEEIAIFTAKQEGIKKEKFLVLNNIIEYNLKGIFERNKLRKDLDIPEDSLVALTVGRFNPEKQQNKIIETADIVVNKLNLKKVYFLIVGFGMLEAELNSLVEKRNLKENVRIIVDPLKAKEYCVAGDIFLLSSHQEGRSVALLEAMSAGLTGVVTSVGGLKEIVNDGENGYLVDVNDTDAMAEKIIWLFNHPNELKRMQAAGKATVDNFRGRIEDLENLFKIYVRNKRI